MLIKTITCLFIVLGFFSTVSSNELGPDVSVYRGEELKWEDGAYGYFVMFKSMLDENRHCAEDQSEKIFTLYESLIPQDAFVKRAFLVWTGAQPTDKIDEFTDNEVLLNFKSADGKIDETETVTATKYKVTEPQGFEFDSFVDGDSGKSYFAYRIDVTDFFEILHEKGLFMGIKNDGEALFGDYTVSNLDCVSDHIYLENKEIISGWALIIIYTSYEIPPKNIYIYDGFNPIQSEITEIDVCDFELPKDPEIRLTFLTHLGDPDIISTEASVPPEGIQLQGQSTASRVFLENECNPYVVDPFNYVETYNSVSSTFGYNDYKPVCVSEEYGIESDSFLIDGSKMKYEEHFKKGNTSFYLRIGTNEDRIITNTLIVSTDTKAEKFDIPFNPETPDGRELSYCSCSTEKDSVCFDRPFYYLIKIQNWGENLVEKVILHDPLPDTVEYVAESTEIATEFHDGIGTNWKKIDDVKKEFPFKNTVKVAELMGYCDKATFECQDTIMVRFVVKPKIDLPKYKIILNSAEISDAGKIVPYNTNSFVPLRLRNGNCPPITECNLPPKSECGGAPMPCCNECHLDTDCDEGMCCNEAGFCQTDPCVTTRKCHDSEIMVLVGKNSIPNNVFFISPQINFVLGQLALFELSGEECFFNIASLKLKFDLSDTNISLSNIKLVNDFNGNGMVDNEDLPLSSVDKIKDGYADFPFSDPNNRIWAYFKNNLLFVADVDYAENKKITNNSTFTPSIEEGGLTIVDAGTPEISGLPIIFSKFQMVPENTFAIMKGEEDSQYSDNLFFNYKDSELLQFKAFSNGRNDMIKSVTITIPDGGTVNFGNGIHSISIFYDKYNDGTNEELLIRAEKTDSKTSHKFNLDIPFEDGVWKYFVIKADVDVDEEDHFQIQISDIEIESNNEILGLPLNSKEYYYKCDPMYSDCYNPVPVPPCGIFAVSCSFLFL